MWKQREERLNIISALLQYLYSCPSMPQNANHLFTQALSLHPCNCLAHVSRAGTISLHHQYLAFKNNVFAKMFSILKTLQMLVLVEEAKVVQRRKDKLEISRPSEQVCVVIVNTQNFSNADKGCVMSN